MNQNWPDFFQRNIRSPETVAEAVDRLMMILDGEQKITLAIRNAFGLHEPGSKLLASCGVFVHPDDASGVIIRKLWKKLGE